MTEHPCKQEFRVQTLEKKVDVLTEGQHDLEKTLAVMAERLDNTNAHLSEMKEILRAFPEMERATWEDHWEQVFERQNKILELKLKESAPSNGNAQLLKTIGILAGALVATTGAAVLVIKFLIK